MLRKNRQPRHGTEDATIVSLTNQVELNENHQDAERLKIETITNINGNGIAARGIDLCNFIQRNGPEICPTPNGNNSCPLEPICEEGGLLTDFCESIAKECSEDCMAAFSSCENCGNADLDCSSMSQEMNLADSVHVGSKSHPFTGTTNSPQRSDSTIMGSLTNVFDMDSSQKVDLCLLRKYNRYSTRTRTASPTDECRKMSVPIDTLSHKLIRRSDMRVSWLWPLCDVRRCVSHKCVPRKVRELKYNCRKTSKVERLT